MFYALVVAGLLAVAFADFASSRLLIAAAFLAAIAALKLHEMRVTRKAEKLARWPRRVPASLEAMLADTLDQACDLLQAPVSIVWQDIDGPTMRVAKMKDGQVTLSEEPLRRRCEGTKFDGEYASGWLRIDKPNPTTDDTLLAEIVAGLIESRFEQFYLSERLRQNTLADERVRFARDLHDGILQSLSGTAMHLQRLRDVMARDPEAARLSLDKMQEAILTDQQDVRSYVERLRCAMLIDEHPLLGSRLRSLAERVESERGTVVRVESSPMVEMISPGMAEEAYRVIREAVMNAAAHADATSIDVEVTMRDDRLRITVQDDGHGFAFKGHYDLHALTLQRRGPVVLKERVWALMGDLVIESQPTGSRLEIELPTSLAKVPM